MKIPHTCLALLGVVVLQSQAFGQFSFSSVLSHHQETGAAGMTPLTTSTGAPRPESFGFATLTLNAAMTSLSMTITVFNIDVTGTQTVDLFDDLTAAHIHAAALTGQPGTNAGVVFGFFGMPFNDNNPNDATMTPFASGVGGVFTAKWDLPEGNNTTLAAQLGNIWAERAYLNFHTRQFPGGEIRGQIVPDSGSSILLLGLAALGLVAVRAHTQRSRA